MEFWAILKDLMCYCLQLTEVQRNNLLICLH